MSILRDYPGTVAVTWKRLWHLLAGKPVIDATVPKFQSETGVIYELMTLWKNAVIGTLRYAGLVWTTALNTILIAFIFCFLVAMAILTPALAPFALWSERRKEDKRTQELLEGTNFGE